MAINPSDISNIGLAGGSPVEAMAQGYKLADLVDQRQINQMRMAGAQQEQQDLQTLKSLSSKYDLSNPEGQSKFAAEAIKVNPDLGMKLQKQFYESQTEQNKLTESQYKLMGQKMEFEANAVAPLWQTATQMQAQGRSQQEIDAALMGPVAQTLKTLSQTTLPNGKPVLSQEEISGFTAKLQNGNIKSALDGIMISHAKGADLLKGQQFGRPVEMTGEQGPGMYQQDPTTGAFRRVGGLAPTAAERGGGGGIAPKVQRSEILTGGAVMTVMDNGESIVRDTDGNVVTGKERSELLKNAGLSKIEQSGEMAATKQLREDAVKNADVAFKSSQSIRANIVNLKEAIAQIDAGANTGVIASKFPNLLNASIELQNIQSRLGLDVVGQTTFGALSGSELNLALQTGLPTNLEGPALKQWLIKRIEAQENVSKYLTKQATYLSKRGNTLAGWMEKMQNEAEEKQRSEAQGGGAPSEQSPAPSSSGAPPSPPGATGGGTPKQITEGTIAYGPDGRKIIVRGGEWQPMN
jgi:hypothetical protein